MRIFDYTDYRSFTVDTVKAMPKSGRGELLKIAEALGIHTSTLSHVLSGIKQLTLDQACSLADYFGLNDIETEYFIKLVELDRAGTERFKSVLKQQMAKLRRQGRDLSKVVPAKKALSAEESATYYSNWFYAGIFTLSSIEGYQTVDAISKYLNLPKRLVNQVVSFLLSTGICVTKGDLIVPGTTYLHLESDSPLISVHHSRWRQKAIERHPVLTDRELAYSSPMSLSVADVEKVRGYITSLISEVNKVRDPSPCETTYVLNIDWIKF
jgi:transcriptional regulator with XRE-family HTH domain